jgi:23S rRNA-/tRNA-specific pseudouridylate synthase
MLSVATGKERKTLYSLLNAYIKVNARMQRKEDLISGRQPDRSNAKVWIVHRLDKGTSGAMVFAKNERAKDILQSKWKDLVAERKYVAWLEGHLEKEQGAIQSWLVENTKSLKMNSFDTEVKDGQLAITHYRVLSTSRHYSQVEFSLETGRKNQIRVHSATLGCPVAGDEKYGAQTDPIRRLALHAHTLVVATPFPARWCAALLPFRNPLKSSPTDERPLRPHGTSGGGRRALQAPGRPRHPLRNGRGGQLVRRSADPKRNRPSYDGRPGRGGRHQHQPATARHHGYRGPAQGGSA